MNDAAGDAQGTPMNTLSSLPEAASFR